MKKYRAVKEKVQYLSRRQIASVNRNQNLVDWLALTTCWLEPIPSCYILLFLFSLRSFGFCLLLFIGEIGATSGFFFWDGGLEGVYLLRFCLLWSFRFLSYGDSRFHVPGELWTASRHHWDCRVGSSENDEAELLVYVDFLFNMILWLGWDWCDLLDWVNNVLNFVWQNQRLMHSQVRDCSQHWKIHK